jgi:predicted nucleotidyltransferase
MVQIFELMGRKSNSKVLGYFLAHPTEEAYARQLEKKLKIAKKSLLDALAMLLREGLIEMKEIGRAKEYRLMRNDARAKQLKILCTVDALLQLLDKMDKDEVEVYLFGSAARGEDTEKSDIDLLFIGKHPESEALEKIRDEEKIKPIFLTFLEYSSLARKDKPFYERIEKDRIRLI